MPEKKKKRDLTTTIEHIERYHSRRSAFVIHATLSAAIQVAMWLNWFASYVVHGDGFDGPFFSDRFIVSMVLTIFLIGHLVLMRLRESKDKLVILALKQGSEDDLDQDSANDYRLSVAEESQPDYDDPIVAYLSNSKR